MIAPNRGDCPQLAFTLCAQLGRSVVLSLNGAIVGGSYDLGWGSQMSELLSFYDGLDNKYRCEMLEVRIL